MHLGLNPVGVWSRSWRALYRPSLRTLREPVTARERERAGGYRLYLGTGEAAERVWGRLERAVHMT